MTQPMLWPSPFLEFSLFVVDLLATFVFGLLQNGFKVDFHALLRAFAELSLLTQCSPLKG